MDPVEVGEDFHPPETLICVLSGDIITSRGTLKAVARGNPELDVTRVVTSLVLAARFRPGVLTMIN